MASLAGQIRMSLRTGLDMKHKKVIAGLRLAGLFLLRESQKIVPVDYGPLKASGFVRQIKHDVVVGYTANYAVFVHENPDALHGAAFNAAYAKQIAAHPKTGPYRHKRGANQVYKFLEAPFRRNVGKMVQIVAAAS